MDGIKRVTIKNFRSIVRQEFEPADLTLFVGQNDSGKSNFLRALNLFFNGQTDLGQPLSFTTDFSTSAKVGRGKARQIEVWIDLQPPASFSDQSVVRWKRAWREDSTSYAWQEIKRINESEELGRRSKVHPWLSRIRYKYVPAIKGADYFSALLRDVHDVLAETVDKELRGASTNFIKAIRSHTEQIAELTSETMGLDSQLQLPTDLRALFEVLDFETSSEGGSKSLRQRGDGIKVRHISAILKFLSDQERKLSGPGRARPTTIWGYEEPENNLELTRAFQHAEELYGYSNDIQILISTHSPAFYSLLSKGPDVRAYSVIPPTADGTELKRVDADQVTEFDESLGLMALVAPFVKAKADELATMSANAAALAAELKEKKKLVILVGGETDAQYIGAAFELAKPTIAQKVVVGFVGKPGASGASGGGDSNLLRFAGELSIKQELGARRILVLLDCDVQKVPDDSNNVWYRRIPLDTSKKVFRRGIENLLPDELALDRFYTTTEHADEYGGNVLKTNLNKVDLCRAVCDKGAKLPVAWPDRLHGFKCVLNIAEEVLQSMTTGVADG